VVAEPGDPPGPYHPANLADYIAGKAAAPGIAVADL
jgi:hypothetical protein